MIHHSKVLSTLALSILGASPASATTYTLSLSQSGSFVLGSSTSTYFVSTTTANLSPTIPNFTLIGGDILDVVVNLTTPMTVPAASFRSSILIKIPAATSSTITANQGYFFGSAPSLFLAGILQTIPWTGVNTGTTSFLGLGAQQDASPTTTAFTFDRAVAHVTISPGSTFAFSTSSTASIIGTTLTTPVPESSTFVYMLLGFAGVFKATRCKSLLSKLSYNR